MNDNELDQLLHETEPQMTPPAGFQRDVWRRIESIESTKWRLTANLKLRRLWDLLTSPPVAVATCAVMIALGTWAGLKTETSHPGSELAYLRSVSPFLRTHK